MNKKSKLFPLLVAFSAFLFLGNKGCVEFVPKPIPESSGAVPEIQTVLLNLLNLQAKAPVLGDNFSSPSQNALVTLGTPDAILIKLRYERLGITLVEALKTSRDDQLLSRVFELAEWSDNDVARAEALVTLGSFSDPKDLRYFKTALADKDVTIRFAAVEGLQKWNLPEGLDLLKQVAGQNWSPLVQVLAAQALLSQGEEQGLAVLHEALRHKSWIVRAMAARYLGDYGTDKDGDAVFRALNRENDNDFVLAELAIAAIKLGAGARGREISATPAASQKSDSDPTYQVDGDIIEMAPLVLRPPRLRLSKKEKVSPTINNKLLLLIRDRLDKELTEQDKNDPNLQDLYEMSTPLGYALQTRYSNLSVLVAEGLGGTGDAILRQELITLAAGSPNPLTRATAIVSLGYSGKEQDLNVIQDGLSDQNPKIRFAAMEAVLAGGFKELVPSVLNIAFQDDIPLFRVYAMRVAAAFGDPAAYNLLLSNQRDPDWIARSMTYWYLGRYGRPADFNSLLSNLSSETNPFVQAELALGASRLSPIQ